MNLHQQHDKDQLLHQYQDFIYFCLHRCMIDGSWSDYDDYAQVARLALLDAYKDSKFDPLSRDIEIRRQFMSYARRRIQWKIRDYQRQDYRNKEREIYSDEWLEAQTVEDMASQATIDQDLLKRLEENLNPQEIQLVVLLLNEELTHTQRIQRLGVSRDTYYRWRTNLRNKLMNLHFLSD